MGDLQSANDIDGALIVKCPNCGHTGGLGPANPSRHMTAGVFADRFDASGDFVPYVPVPPAQEDPGVWSSHDIP